MNLLASVNSFNDVVEKWIEVIDDLVRQIIKSNYAVDINNLPATETTMDHKRKLKKKQLQNSSNLLPSNEKQSLLSLSEQQQQLMKISSFSTQQQQQQQQVTKARAQTELNPAAYFHASIIPNTENLTLNQMAASTITITNKSSNESATTTTTAGANTATNHISPGEPTLNRQRKISIKKIPLASLLFAYRFDFDFDFGTASTKIQKTFRDDTYLHSFGICFACFSLILY